MRILLAHSFYRTPGGEDRYVQQQLSLLRSIHDVELLSRSNSDLSAGPGTIARMATGFPGRKEVERTFDSFKPDVVHLHNVYPALGPAVHLVAGARGVPVVFTVHNFRLRCPNGYMFTNGQICRRCEGGAYHNAVVHDCLSTRSQSTVYAGALWLHRFALRLENKVSRFVAPSKFMEQRLRDWGVPGQNIAYIPNFTTIPDAPQPHGEHGLFLGRMSDEKGLDALLSALKDAGDPPFVLAGDGPALTRLKRKARDIGLSAARFVGRVGREEVQHLLSGARFVVLASSSEENAPLAALEAMAFGKPLIVTALGGLVELVREQRGIAVPAGDTVALAAAIRKMVNDPSECRRLGDRARSHAIQHFSPEAHLDRLNRCYEEAVAPRV